MYTRSSISSYDSSLLPMIRQLSIAQFLLVWMKWDVLRSEADQIITITMVIKHRLEGSGKGMGRSRWTKSNEKAINDKLYCERLTSNVPKHRMTSSMMMFRLSRGSLLGSWSLPRSPRRHRCIYIGCVKHHNSHVSKANERVPCFGPRHPDRPRETDPRLSRSLSTIGTNTCLSLPVPRNRDADIRQVGIGLALRS
jgi:hypothetical protein